MSRSDTILVVEDEPANRDALVDYLEDEGFRALAAADGAEALARLAGDDVDVVITDLKMPRMGGMELIERARESWPDVPCIIVSGHGQMGDAVAAMRLGAYDYLEKPLAPLDPVGLAVRRALDHRRLVRENRSTLEQVVRSNAALAHAKEELEETQEQLVQAAKMAALGEMVAGVAHEINNPLGFVYSNVRVLGETLESLETLARSLADGVGDTAARAEIERLRGRIERLLEGCRVGTERTREIVERLRRFARPGEGELAEVDLAEVLETAVTFVSHRIGPEVRLQRDFAATPRVPCRGGEIGQVFVNLLANALDAIAGRGQIWLRTRVAAGPPRGAPRGGAGPWVETSIRDSGPGLPPDARERLFEPFFTTKPPGQGTGLGLSVSYGIVRHHGGVMEAGNHPEGGAEVRVLLPVTREHEAT